MRQRFLNPEENLKKSFLLLGSVLIGMISLGTQAVQAQPVNRMLMDSTSQFNSPNRFPRTSNLSSRYQFKTGEINPVNGEISIRLVNNINAPVTYQVVGDTEARVLPQSSTTLLTSLDTPTSVMIYRKDDGLVSATAYETSKPGVLEVHLTDAYGLQIDDRSVWVNPDGEVFVN